MSTDLPIVVGVGQATNRVSDLNGARSHLKLMTAGARAAAADSGQPGILRHAGSVRVVNVVSWRGTTRFAF